MCTASDKYNFLTLPDGSASVDNGAGQDLIGRSAFVSLQEHLCGRGLKAVVLPHAPRTAKGSGESKSIAQVPLPLFIGGV